MTDDKKSPLLGLEYQSVFTLYSFDGKRAADVLKFENGETYLDEKEWVEGTTFANRHSGRLVGPFPSPEDAERFIVKTPWFCGDAAKGRPPLFYVDFNELMEFDVVLLSATDWKRDADGNDVYLSEGLAISIYSDDVGEDGKPDNLVADGVVIPNKYTGSFPHVRWCCRISSPGIRHQSDFTR